MAHFTIGAWIDFVQRQCSVEERMAMEAHLLSGCGECKGTVALFERVRDTASSMAHAAAEPPPDLVLQAKSLFHAPAKEEGKVRRLFGRLVYDSFSQLMPSGARAALPAFRHVLFHAGDYCIDLRLESDPNSIRNTLAGQLTSRKDPAAKLGGVEVLLSAGSRVISQARSNDFGEFILDYAHVGGLRLEFPLAGGSERLEVSLRRLRDKQ